MDDHKVLVYYLRKASGTSLCRQAADVIDSLVEENEHMKERIKYFRSSINPTEFEKDSKRYRWLLNQKNRLDHTLLLSTITNVLGRNMTLDEMIGILFNKDIDFVIDYFIEKETKNNELPTQ